MQEGRIRVGVAGVGRMGGYHVQKFAQLSEAELIGIYDADSLRAGAVADQHGTRAFAQLDELLVEVDALVVASPTATHAEIARRAIEARVHVLVEKPLASGSHEAASLVRLAEDRGILLQVGMVERFRLQALAGNTPLRPVRFIETHRLAVAPGRESGIDVVADLMIHDLDLVLSLVGEDPVSVSAVGLPVVCPESDIANVRLEFPSGAVANLTASRISRGQLRKFRVFTADAYLSLDFVANSAEVSRLSAAGRIERDTKTLGPIDSLLEQCRDFVRCVRTGERPLVSGVDGLRALEYAELVTRKIAERSALLNRRDNMPAPRPSIPV